MSIELGFGLYLIFGICLYLVYKEDVREHTSRVTTSNYMKRMIYIVTFIVTLLLWPLLLGV